MSKYTNEQILEFIENDCKDWTELKVLNIVDKNQILIQDNEGYKYLTSYAVIRNARKRNLKLSKFFRNNPYTIDNINNYLENSNINYTLRSNVISNAKENVIWNCSIHGDFKTSWNCIQSGQGCPECGKEIAASKRRNSYDYIKGEFEKKNLILISDTYINNETPLEFICPKHSEEGVQKITYGYLIGKDTGCFYCNRETYLKKITKSHEQFKIEINSVHGDKYELLTKYKGAGIHIKVKCNECGNVWSAKASHLLSGHGCPRCKSPSKGEDLIRDYLLSNNIVFKEQYRIKECRYKRPLPFDFAIFNRYGELLCLIEFDGRQHFKASSFGSKSQSKTDKNFELQKIRDGIKNDYCTKHNIPLIRIPYWEIENIKQILTAKLMAFFS